MLTKFEAEHVPLKGSNLIEASAGTGKTYSIAILALRLLLEEHLEIKEVLMVTYTKAAVAELEERIRLFIRLAYKAARGEHIADSAIAAIVTRRIEAEDADAVRERLRAAVLLLDETAVMTIHSFCQQSLNEFAFETGQLFNCETLEDPKLLIQEEVNKFWRERVTTIRVDILRELIAHGFSRGWLAEAIQNYFAGRPYVGYNEANTYVLDEDYLQSIADEITAAFEAVKACREALYAHILANSAQLAAVTNANANARKALAHLLDDHEAFMELVLERRGSKYIRDLYGDLLERCDEITALEGRMGEIIWKPADTLLCMAIRQAGVNIDAYKLRNSLLSFEDMITNLHRAAAGDEQGRLRGLLQKKYKAVFVDEFQDTDKLQYEIFERFFAQGPVLFYIGDPKQSIYSFRKADIYTYFKAAANVDHQYGMNTNFRACPSLIEAMNIFFMPAADFDPFSFSGVDDAIVYINVEAPPGLDRMGAYRGEELQVPLNIYDVPNQAAGVDTVARKVLDLLSDPDYRLVKNDQSKKIGPSDIGILVRNRFQGADIKAALGRLGVPAVTIDDSRVLESAEAGHVLALLNAFEEPGRASINKSLLSPFTGMTREDLLELDEDLVLEQFKAYGLLWQEEGIFVTLSKFIMDYDVKPRLLGSRENGGERIITNLMQLTEVLHKIQTSKQLANIELINWLKKATEGMSVDGDEYEQRVESDEESVKIVTIHKSKGLEYPLVFAPNLDLNVREIKEFCSFRDHDQGEYLFAHDTQLTTDQRAAYDAQQEQENRRLLYVAVTRAVYQCFIMKNTWHTFNNSSLAAFYKALKIAPPRPDLILFADRGQIPDRQAADYALAWQPLLRLEAQHFRLADTSWHKLSYTFLSKKQPYVLRGNERVTDNDYDYFVFKQLARGSITGNLLHYIFENIGFQNVAGWERTIVSGLQRFFPGTGERFLPMLLRLAEHTIGALITIGGERVDLRLVSRHDRISEFEFDFPVGLFDSTEIDALSSGDTFIMSESYRALSGVMNGKIDLFFELNGKYYILDWKSNFLGDGLEDYEPEQLQAAMNDHNYHLQYLIYSLALKKYLAFRLPGFSYEEHFGGVIYLFVRGTRKDLASGVFTYRPALEEILKAEQLFGKQAVG